MKGRTSLFGLFTSFILFPAWPQFLFSQETLDQRVTNLSQQIAEQMTENKKTTIAVVEFSDLQGNITDFGRFLAEELITRLYQTKKFKVIERQQLNKVIAEQKLSLTGIIEPNSAKKLGKLLGVDAVAAGTITDLAQSLRVNARLISTETGEIFAVAATEIFKDESVTKLMKGIGTSPPDKKPESSDIATSDTEAHKVETNNFTFELKEVKMSGTTVTCDLTITNNDNNQDRNLVLHLKDGLSGRQSRIFDEFGNEYSATYVQLGNKERRGAIGDVTNTLVSGIPTKVKISFEKVSVKANKITLLEISCQLGSWTYFKAQFRNIPITR
jgi:TolB-like protein